MVTRSETVQSHRRINTCFPVCIALVATVALTGCQSQGGGGVDLPNQVVVWGDPEDPEIQGRNVRDANNDDESFVLIGTNGRVQFEPLRLVCNDCQVEGATIELETGQLIDIRFGLGPDGTGGRRPFLVDRESGEFIELLGGRSEPVEFRRSGAMFEEPDDRADDLAVAVDEAANPTVASNGGGSGSGGLCGALGAAMIPVVLGGMVLIRQARRGW
jgi:hypothetical protein